MKKPTFLTITEQVAAHLHEEIRKKRWSAEMPGRQEVAESVGVSPQTAQAALLLLEKEGVLEAQGAGKRRKIVSHESGAGASKLRIAMLMWRRHGPYDPFISDLQHRLVEAGHEPFTTRHGLMELDMDVHRVKRMVADIQADAWIVHAAPRDIYDWFAVQPFPVFGFLGSFGGLPIAATGPDFGPPLRECTEELIRLGHRRIVMIGRPQRRIPRPEYPETVFLDVLQSHGIVTGDYHFPLWPRNSSEGLHACLRTIFEATPPTALIIQEAKVLVATQQFLASRGISVPCDVSLVCTDGDVVLDWQRPPMAQFTWESAMWVRRTVRWAENISRGKEDHRQTLYAARFVPGGTMGPVPVKSTSRT